MELITKQSTFSRVLANEGKMGAYYTDLEHCKWISNFLEFPEGEEICCLEPSIGNGMAIKTITNAENNANIKIFGVEVNHETAGMVKEDQQITEVLDADFLNGIKISSSVFSFCFSNPPYGVDEQNSRQRLEKLFCEKLTNYVKNNGVVVFVIPYSVFVDDKMLKSWVTRYETLFVFKFHEHEFVKYKQIVVFGRKKPRVGYQKKEFDDLYSKICSIENISDLPVNYTGERIKVYPTSTSQITIFARKDFSVEKAMYFLNKSPVYQMINKKGSQKVYASSELTSPVIKLKPDLMYLLAVAGAGEGLAGDEEAGDLHLQRGSVKVAETGEIEPRGEDSLKVRCRTSSSICMTVIENDGKITRFE